MAGFRNANVYVEGKGIIKTSIQFVDGKITSFDDDEKLDSLPENLIVVPGFIDEHIHGANGSDTMYATRKDLENIASSLTQDGVTSFYPTTMSMSLADVKKALICIASNLDVKGASIKGINVEGPFISVKYCGAQDTKNIIKATKEDIEDLVKTSNDLIRIMTIAYEENGPEIAKCLLDHNIIVSLGHSDCKADIAEEAFNLGANTLTHTYNAMRGIHHRDIGLLGQGLMDDRVYAELICDLHHVSAKAIQLLYRLKGKDKICLITDSMEARFLENGKYALGGQDVFVKDGVATLASGVLAGSVLRMNEAVRNIKNVLKISLTDAIDMATINVARHMKIDNITGSIKLGNNADFAVVDKDLNVYMTIVNGQIVYKK